MLLILFFYSFKFCGVIKSLFCILPDGKLVDKRLYSG